MIATKIPDCGVLVSLARALNYIDQNSFPLFVERPSAIDLNLLKKLRMVRIYDEMGLDPRLSQSHKIVSSRRQDADVAGTDRGH